MREILVLIAGVVASPLAYYLIRKWLENFAYQIRINPLIFVLSGMLALLFAFLTISFHSIRAAHANLVNSLKYEKNLTVMKLLISGAGYWSVRWLLHFTQHYCW